jgi:hypothetical protein
VTVPAGGEVWQRFQAVTIRWNDNISENVAIDIYKDGVSNRTITAGIASSGSYAWTVGQFQAFPPGTNYTVKIRSTTNPALYDFSEPFSMITNLTSFTIATVPTGRAVTVDGTNYSSPAVFNWLPTSSHTVDTASPQVAGDGHSRSLFGSWSDGGAQSHSIIVPFSTTNCTATFSTQYLLDISTTPAGGGTVSNNPAGPWYASNQLVSLTANGNPCYVFSSWGGVDSPSGNTAQVTMSSYRSVVATFLSQLVIDNQSINRLPDGRIQFGLTAPGATQAMVLGSTNLSAWEELKSVPVTNGSAVFIDDTATNYPARFYRVRVP